MPLGWECRSKLIKQLPAKPTVPRSTAVKPQPPGPSYYDTPQIMGKGGNGYSRIKRAPAYTFGHLTPAIICHPASQPNAPVFNIRGLRRNGATRITHSVVTPHIEPVVSNMNVPGPGTYAPRLQVSIKRPPAYSIQRAAKPPYQAWDMWTPSSNMYCPPITSKRAPAYSLGYTARQRKGQDFPGPGEHEPNFNYPKKRRPSYSFGIKLTQPKPSRSPGPNAHCEKKFMYTKRTVPSPSFGIRHSPYVGKQEEYRKSSKIDLES